MHKKPVCGVVNEHKITASHHELRARRIEAAVIDNGAAARRLPLSRIDLRLHIQCTMQSALTCAPGSLQNGARMAQKLIWSQAYPEKVEEE